MQILNKNKFSLWVLMACWLVGASAASITSQSVLDMAKANGFSVSPAVSYLELNDQLRSEATLTTPDYQLKATLYGITMGWGSPLSSFWSNKLSVHVAAVNPRYDTAITKTNATDFFVEVEDLFMHQSHQLGHFLPYFGIGADVYKVTKKLNKADTPAPFAEGAKRSAKFVYFPVGTVVQFNRLFGAKIQVNWAPFGTETLIAHDFKHDRSSLGYAVSLNWRAPFGMSQNVVLTPFYRSWQLNTEPVASTFTEEPLGQANVALKSYHRRVREAGIQMFLGF